MSLWKLIRLSAPMILAFGTSRLLAEPDAAPKDRASTNVTLPNLAAITAGGKQFWADEWLFHDWRIQRNSITGHCRLLDGDNHRHAWGTFDACKARLDEIRSEQKLPPMHGKGVIVLHGLFRSRSSMKSLCEALSDQGAYSVFAVGYPTTRGSVADHAKSLDSVIRSLEGIEEINFVGHSLGNLVVRHWLNDTAEQKRTLPPGKRFGRMVMLGPPNHHPQIAAQLLSSTLATMMAGPAAEQLASGWQTLEPELTTPPFEFGILAGGKGDGEGYNPFLAGDDDGVVTVESTRLAGARDFRRLPVLHSFMMNDVEVQKLTVQFLIQGHFENNASRQPIAAKDAASEIVAKP